MSFSEVFQARNIAGFLMSYAAVAALASPAHADDGPKWHADIGVQLSEFDGEDEDLPAIYDGTLGAINGHVGYNFSKFIGVEAEFGLGIREEEDIATYDPRINFFVPPPVVDLKQSYLVGLSGRLQYEVVDDLVLFAKGGFAHSKFKRTQTSNLDIAGQAPVVTETDFEETAPSFGVGAQYYFSESSGLRLDITRYEFDNFASQAVSLGYSHRF